MNIGAIALATFAAFLIGFAWFNGKTFYPAWYRALGKEVPQRPEKMSKDDIREGNIMFAGTLASQVAQAIGVALVVDLYENAYGSVDALSGAGIGLMLGLCIAAFTSLPHRLFSGQGFKVWLIEIGGDVIALIAMGAIIGGLS